MTEGGDDVELSIPPKELWWIKTVVTPYTFYTLSWSTARALFQEEMKSIIRTARTLSAEQLNQPACVERIQGLQETSRNWSAGMVIDHLNKFNNIVAELVPALHAKEVILYAMTMDSIAPAPGHTLDTIARFELIGRQFSDMVMTNYMLKEPSRDFFSHPWLGPLNQQQWLKIAAVHQQLHRKQLDLIVKEVLHSKH